jgi:hypothetical protein
LAWAKGQCMELLKDNIAMVDNKVLSEVVDLSL